MNIMTGATFGGANQHLQGDQKSLSRKKKISSCHGDWGQGGEKQTGSELLYGPPNIISGRSI